MTDSMTDSMTMPRHPVSSIVPRASYENEDRGPLNFAVSTFLMVLPTVFVLMRIVARRLKSIWGLEDWFCIAALITHLASGALNYVQIANGLGRHVEFVPLNRQVVVQQCLLAVELLYNVTMVLVKFSLCYLYMRLFPLLKTHVYIVGGFISAWGIAFTIVLIFQCNPLDKFWQPNIGGTCLDPRPIFVSNAVLNFFSDMALLCMPITQVVRLEIKTPVKASVCSIFLLGGFVSFAGLYRIKTLLAVDPTDATWTFVDSNIWTMVETSGAVISACLPTLRPLLAKVSATFSSLTTRKGGSTTLSRIQQTRNQTHSARIRRDSSSTMELPIYDSRTDTMTGRELDEYRWQDTGTAESEASTTGKSQAKETIAYAV